MNKELISYRGSWRQYYITIDKYSSDEDIAKLLNMSLETYRQVLKEQYKACDTSLGVYFYRKKDIEKALEWVESQLLLAKLINAN